MRRDRDYTHEFQALLFNIAATPTGGFFIAMATQNVGLSILYMFYMTFVGTFLHPWLWGMHCRYQERDDHDRYR